VAPDADDDKIRQRAYEIWEDEGRPHGREREHWAAAERELAGGGSRPAATKAQAKQTRASTTLKEDPEAENLGKPSKKSRGSSAVRESPRK
jgi:hypothetical protein